MPNKYIRIKYSQAEYNTYNFHIFPYFAAGVPDVQFLNHSYCLTVFDADLKMPVKIITVYHVWNRL